MWKTFVASPLAGGVSAALGWMGALLFEGSMSRAEFATLRFGWPGAIVGGIAIACVLVLFLSGSTIEPLTMIAAASVGGALLWNVRELPFSTINFRNGTATNYWVTVSMMVAVMILLLVGLRSTRDATNRTRR
jgi:hypothetical protein